MNNNPGHTILAYPDKIKGSVKIRDFRKILSNSSFHAHNSAITHLSFNNDASLMATTSNKVKII